MKHTPTPWTNEYDGSIIGSNEDVVLSDKHLHKTDIKRIIDCVNAMHDIEDPKKLRETWEVVKDLELDAYHKMKQERDDVLDVLKTLSQIWIKGYSVEPNSAIASAVLLTLSEKGLLIVDGSKISTASLLASFNERITKIKEDNAEN
jgi:hypothetical protein